MVRILDYKAVEPLQQFNLTTAINIPNTPHKLKLAKLTILIPKHADKKNRVELIATAGVRGIIGILNKTMLSLSRESISMLGQETTLMI